MHSIGILIKNILFFSKGAASAPGCIDNGLPIVPGFIERFYRKILEVGIMIPRSNQKWIIRMVFIIYLLLGKKW
jgi:hypothetical protein